MNLISVENYIPSDKGFAAKAIDAGGQMPFMNDATRSFYHSAKPVYGVASRLACPIDGDLDNPFDVIFSEFKEEKGQY